MLEPHETARHAESSVERAVILWQSCPDMPDVPTFALVLLLYYNLYYHTTVDVQRLNTAMIGAYTAVLSEKIDPIYITVRNHWRNESDKRPLQRAHLSWRYEHHHITSVRSWAQAPDTKHEKHSKQRVKRA